MIGVFAEQLEGRLPFSHHLVDDALMAAHQRHQLRQQHAADGRQVALSLQHAGEAGKVGLQPVLIGVALRRQAQVADHGVDVVFELGDLAACVDLNGARQVALGHGRRHLGDGAHLVGQVVGEQVHVAGEILPRTGGARHVGLAAEAAFDAHLARHRRHLIGEDGERVGHVVDGLGERRDLALRLHRQLLLEVALGDGRHDLDDAAHLLGEVGGHDVDGVGQILPRAGDARHLRLAAELAFGADLARNARHLRGKAVELIDHRVDGVLQLENFALHVDGDLARKVAAGDGRRHLGDVAHLAGEVAGHRVDGVGQVLPRAGDDARHDGLAAETPFGADLAGDARHLGRERAQLLDHRVQRLLQQQDLAAHVDGDLLRQVAAGDGRRHLGDVAHLGGEVRRHEVDVVGQILPRAGDAGHLRLAAELAFGADLAGHARHLAGKAVELIHHRVDGGLELEDLALHVDGDALRQVAAGDGRRHVGDVAHLGGQVAGQQVDVVGQILPRAGDARHVGLAAERPSVPTSRATRVTSPAKRLS